MGRADLIAVLGEMSKMQQVVQEKIVTLSRTLIQEGQTELSFLEAYQKVQKVELPRDPLEKYGITERDLEHILFDYEEDTEVMMARVQLLSPGRDVDDPATVKSITIGMIIQVHQLMEVELQTVIDEYKQVPLEERCKFTK